MLSHIECLTSVNAGAGAGAGAGGDDRYCIVVVVSRVGVCGVRCKIYDV